MRSQVVVVLAGILALGCGKKKDDGAAGAGSAGSGAAPAPTAAAPNPPPTAAPSAAPAAGGAADPWKSDTPSAPGAPAAAAGDDDDVPTPVAAGDDNDVPTPVAAGGDESAEPGEPAAVVPASTRSGVIAQVCAKDAACGCPIPDCEAGFAKITTIPTSVWGCILQQPCDMLCAPKSGAPGTELYKTCLEGKLPAARPSGGGGGGYVNKSCRQSSECGGSYECCGGFCYEMGTSLWITACQMPTGKF